MAKPKYKEEAAAEIKRLWGDTPVVDADKDLRVLIIQKDVEQATRTDAGACVFAQACKRSFGASKVLFFRTVAYVELPKEDGSMRVERFDMPSTMRALVEAFDRGEDVLPKAGFVLKAPSPCNRMDSLVRKGRRRALRERQKLIGKSTRVGNQGIGRFRDRPITVDLAVRSGTGAVHFVPAKARE